MVSFLPHRDFFVWLVNEVLEAGTINSGIQGSTLVPFLFLLYINCIPQAMSNSHTHIPVCEQH